MSDESPAQSPKVILHDDLKHEKGIPFTSTYLWRLERDGKFPKRIRLSNNRVAWVTSEIDAWVDARIAERDAKTGRCGRSEVAA